MLMQSLEGRIHFAIHEFIDANGILQVDGAGLGADDVVVIHQSADGIVFRQSNSNFERRSHGG